MLERGDAGTKHPSLEISPHSPLAPGNLQVKAFQQSTPMAHRYHQNMMVWWQHVLLGVCPNTPGLCATSPALVVVHLPAPYSSLVGLITFPPPELVGLSILTKSCYISHLYLNSLYRKENKLFSIYYSMLQ